MQKKRKPTPCFLPQIQLKLLSSLKSENIIAKDNSVRSFTYSGQVSIRPDDPFAISRKNVNEF